MKTKFDLIAKEATKMSTSWTNVDRSVFHAFNPNGAYTKARLVAKKVDALIDEGRAASGAYVAYVMPIDQEGSKLMDLALQKRVSRTELRVIMSMLAMYVKMAEEFIAEKTAA